MLYSQIVGQDEIKNYLRHAILTDSVSHGYIFEGPKDIGKYDLAMVFAQSLLCLNMNQEPCNICDSCQKVNSMNHPDLHIMLREDKNIKRESIDDIIETIYRRPYEAKRKIYIINDSQDMTTQAANTFLKTLEEPPGDAVIILLTTNSSLLLPTVVSRCQLIKFKNISYQSIKNHLMTAYHADDMSAELAAGYSHGMLNKAVNIISGKDDILIKRKEIIELFDKIIKSDEEIIFEYENYFESQKDNIDEIIEIMMIWIRDIVIYQHDMQSDIINKDCIDMLEEHSRIMKLKAGDELIVYLQDISDNIKYNVNYKIAIDKMLIRLQKEGKK